MSTVLQKSVIVNVLAAMAGAVLTFSFAPFEVALLAPLSIGVFYFLCTNRTGKAAFWTGWFFGVGYFGLGVNWVYHSLHLFGAAVAPLAAVLTVAFCLSLALFPALLALVFSRFRLTDAPLRNALLFASLWALFELLRGKLFGGFPWILVGYSQTTEVLGALAPIIGVYGIGFLVVLWSSMGVILIYRKHHPQTRLTQVVAMAVIVLIPALAWFAGKIEYSVAKQSVLDVRLVQANIPQEMKFSQERLVNSINLYSSMTLDGLTDNTLVVWPETAIPTYFDRVDDVLVPFVKLLEEQNVEVLTGGFHRDGDHVYNSIRQLGGEKALYRKRHLVPFGEFMPLRFLLEPIAAFIDIPMSDLSKGEGPHETIEIFNETIGLSICYEDVYGEEMRASLPAASVLVNVSNDAWFGSSSAPHQHEQKARMRAREFARPLVRVTNTGVSSAIDFDGSILGRISHDEPGVFDVSISPRTGLTPYARTGNWPVFSVALLSFFIVVLAGPAGLFRRRNI